MRVSHHAGTATSGDIKHWLWPAGAVVCHPTRRLTTLDMSEVLAAVEPRLRRLLRGMAPLSDGSWPSVPEVCPIRRPGVPDGLPSLRRVP
jgi:hypothetical protein